MQHPIAFLLAASVGLAISACLSTGRTRPATPVEAHSGLAAAGDVGGHLAAAGRVYRTVPLPAVMRDDVEIRSGHPDSAGMPFVMRIHELAGTVIPPHRHPVDEHLTVLRGTIRFGTGERFDSAALRNLGPGSYAFIPAGTTMFAEVDDGAVVQVHGIGPFHIAWRDGLTVLGATSESNGFRFRLGEIVIGRRGRGRIVQGYSSGALVQYVVAKPDSTRFMAHEAELQRP